MIAAAFFMATLAACGRGGISGLPTPTSNPDAIVLQWFRTGGAAGFCDEMTITTGGLVRLGDCRQPELAEAGLRPVPAEQWNQLQSWLQTVSAYTDVLTEEAEADGITVTIVFNGTGIAAPEEQDTEALHGFAAQLHATLVRLIDTGCTVTAIDTVDLYAAPDWEADVLGTIETDDTLSPDRQTSEGWLGFHPALPGDPGPAGPRWLAPNAQVVRGPGCEILPLVSAAHPSPCCVRVAGAGMRGRPLREARAWWAGSEQYG